MWGARLCKPRRFARTFCQKKQHITLVFDVNRTILIEDKAAGKNQRDELATIIASYCSGTIEQSPSGELTWRLASDQLGLPNKSKGHLSYYDFLRKIFPFPTLNETNENNHQLIENIKKKRREMKKCFFDSGQPGERLFFHLQKLLENSIHENGFSLLPSFYETIIHFLTKQKNIEISICFRTFGDDLAQIQKEWNLFCLGKHPSYRNFIFPQLQLEKKNMGCFFRNGPKSENSFLLMGTTKAPNLKENMNLWKKENNNKEIKIFSGFSEIDNFFQSSFKEKTSLGIRDFYPWWVSQAEKSNSGKLFFIINEKEESENGWDKNERNKNGNSESTKAGNLENKRIKEILFDDNLHIEQYLEQEKFIIDFRCAHTGESVKDIENLIGKVCIKVNPLEAIQNKNYFIDQINKILKN